MNASSQPRYVALDLHKHYAVAAAVNRDGEVLLPPRRIDNDRLPNWAQKHLFPTDVVVIEATTNAYHVYDMLSPLVAEVKVAHARKVRQIAESRRKTDKSDVLILARLLAANLIPEVWVPPHHVRELRQLMTQRRRLVGMHTKVANRLHSVSHSHHLGHPKGKRFTPETTSWKDALTDMERFQVELDLETLHYLEQQIAHITDKIAELSHQEPWASQAMYLMQLPGFGLITTMTTLAAIGDIHRFPSPKHLISYAGLAPGVEQSGTKHRAKPITKEGRKELRHALVEAAWSAVRSDPFWKQVFQRLTRRKHPNDAIVVIARKLLVILWHVLTKQQSYRQYSEERIAYKFLSWAWRLSKSQRGGKPRPQFVRYYLMRMGIGQELKRIELNPKYPRNIAPPEEVERWLRRESTA